MAIHNLKTESVFFWQVVNGQKGFEVRFDDRNYCVGDILCLEEVYGRWNKKTGFLFYVKVVYILRDERFCKEGYCILGLSNRGGLFGRLEPLSLSLVEF